MQQRTKPVIPCREYRHCIDTKTVVAFISVHIAHPFVNLIVNHNAVSDGCQYEYLSYCLPSPLCSNRIALICVPLSDKIFCYHYFISDEKIGEYVNPLYDFSTFKKPQSAVWLATTAFLELSFYIHMCID